MRILKNATSKLGVSVVSHSRPVGPTCPPDCPFLGLACFAQRGHCTAPNVVASWEKNAPADYAEWTRDLTDDLVSAFSEGGAR